MAASDLVSDLATLAVRGGARALDIGLVVGIERVEGGHRVVGERGTVDAAVVVLALGTGNATLTSGVQPELEKRQLFVLDVPVTADRARLPHLVAPVGGGYARPGSPPCCTGPGEGSARTRDARRAWPGRMRELLARSPAGTRQR